MTISGNVSSKTFDTERAGLPMAQIPNQTVLLVTDDAIWPCGLILGKLANGKHTPYGIITDLIGTGDGAETDFIGDVGAIEPGTAEVVAGAITLTDDGCGNLVGIGGSGSVNYETGKVVVSFDAAPANAAEVNLSSKPDPCAVLDSQTDTARSSSALAVKFGSVRKDLLKVGVAVPAEPSAAALARLECRHIYPV